MPYITAPAQSVGHEGRTYFNANYHPVTGADWCAIVEEVKPGETEITAAEYEAMWKQNHDATIPFEMERLDTLKVEIAARPTPLQHAREVQQLEQKAFAAIDKGVSEQAAEDAYILAVKALPLPLTPEQREAELHHCETTRTDILGGPLCDEVCESRGLPKGTKAEGWPEPSVKRFTAMLKEQGENPAVAHITPERVAVLVGGLNEAGR